MQSVRLPLIFLLVVTLTLQIEDSFAEKTPSTPLPEDVLAAIESLCDGYAARIVPALSTFDENGNGQVSLKHFVTEMMGRGFARKPDLSHILDEGEKASLERTHRWNADMDRRIASSIGTDEEGHITKAGVSFAFQDLILYRLNRMGPLDVNGDGRLSLAEYAIGFPATPNQDRDKDGFTDSQKTYFAKRDQNEDGYLEGEEYLGSTERYVTSQVDALLVAMLLPLADHDGDGTISADEMVPLRDDSERLHDPIEISESVFWLRTAEDSDISRMAQKLSESLRGT